jgi:hypothetical protein
MALGVIRVRGNLCKYTGGGPKKKGKFVSCKKQRITGGKKKRGAPKRSAKRAGCKKQVVSNHGNRRCRSVCRNSKGRVTSSKPASGCKSL